ncbi:Protein of unknown function [Gryllus bimaculatus]|nr:Protein of unknown function [Gryllus bimaculatus]
MKSRLMERVPAGGAGVDATAAGAAAAAAAAAATGAAQRRRHRRRRHAVRRWHELIKKLHKETFYFAKSDENIKKLTTQELFNVTTVQLSPLECLKRAVADLSIGIDGDLNVDLNSAY